MPHSTHSHSDNKPPLLPTWRAWYLLVLGALAAEIGVFVWLSRWFAT